HVVSHDPPPGAIVDRNTYVNLVISRGRDEVEEIMSMVNLLGINVRRVDSILDKMGLEVVDIMGVEDDTRAEGTVVDQTPAPGDEVVAGTPVKITVSHRPRPIRTVTDALIEYTHPEEEGEQELRISVFDDIGERILYHKDTPGGTFISLPIKILGEATYKVFYGEEDIENEIFPEEIFSAPLKPLGEEEEQDISIISPDLDEDILSESTSSIVSPLELEESDEEE
ncbi:MAG: PASTA domain-containing protein, partial [Elusimicrobia bacterium]|nr:PASTA domain-containing protein [Elusimicrobiota bacterium]